MKKITFLIAAPITASAFSLFLWAKLMKAFDDMLAPLDEPLTSPWADLGVNPPPRLPPRKPAIEASPEMQRRFDRVMWDHEMERKMKAFERAVEREFNKKGPTDG